MIPSAIRVIIEFALLAIAVSIIVYWPELFPRCSLCHRIKPRCYFSLHKDISLALSRKGNRSLCKKCCAKNKIESFTDLDHYREVQKRVAYQTKSTSWEIPPRW